MTPPFRTMIWRVPLLVAGILGTGMFLGLERYLIYAPERRMELTPAAAGLAYEEVRFPTSDGFSLHGWLIPAPGARATILWCHGNAGNVSHRVDNAWELHRRLGVNVFLFDYRSYGLSDGAFGDLSEEALYRDAEGALAFLASRPELAQSARVYFGRSLGAAVAVELARRKPPAGLILESPFTSIQDMARVLFPFLPIGGLVGTKFDSLRKMPEIRAPLLVLHGDRDEIVPFAQGRRLFDAANLPKTFYSIPGARHNDTYLVGGDAYFHAWRLFLGSLGNGPVIP